MWRAGILLQDDTRQAKNFSSKEKCEEWVLKQIEKTNVKKSIIVNKNNIQERFIDNWR